MRNLCFAVGLALCSGNALAAEFGLGLSVRSKDDGLLYVPIDISKSFRVEPAVRYASSDDSEDGFIPNSRRREFGLGVFGVKQFAEVPVQIYYGGRAHYVDIKNRIYSSGRVQIVDGETEMDGYRIGPTAGVEYRFGQHFSIGAEATYFFNDIEGESRRTVTTIPNLVRYYVDQVEDKEDEVQSNLVFRYMF
jgi:hypothetical protein